MKANVTFEFDEVEVYQDMPRLLSYTRYSYAISRMKGELFRPARKHGYTKGMKIEKFLQTLNNDQQDMVLEAIGELELDFYDILSEEQIPE